MNKRIIRLMPVLLFAFVLFGYCCSYIAEARYSYVTSASSYLTVINGKASCSSIISANSKATKIKATQYLEKKSGNKWSTVSGGTWSDSSTTHSLSMSNSKSDLSSGTYRLRTVFKVYSGSSSETVTKTSSEVTV